MQLIRSSFHVTTKNKKLILFPTASFAFTLVIFATFFAVFVPPVSGPVASAGEHLAEWDGILRRLVAALHPWSADSHSGIQWSAYVGVVVFYLGSMFFSTFINVAFYHEIMKAMAGEGVSLRRGVAFACRRIQPILAWSLFAGSIGVLLQAVSERFGSVGRLVFRLVGFTWSVAATFVIPIMIRNESSNPLVLLKRSATTIKKTWGELVLGYVGIQLLPFVVLIILPLIFIFTQGMSSGMGLVFWTSFALIYGFLAYLANSIFRCALYVYASEGVVPEPYSADLMDAAWKVKRG
jgi:hypothetical protein